MKGGWQWDIDQANFRYRALLILCTSCGAYHPTRRRAMSIASGQHGAGVTPAKGGCRYSTRSQVLDVRRWDVAGGTVPAEGLAFDTVPRVVSKRWATRNWPSFRRATSTACPSPSSGPILNFGPADVSDCFVWNIRCHLPRVWLLSSLSWVTEWVTGEISRMSSDAL